MYLMLLFSFRSPSRWTSHVLNCLELVVPKSCPPARSYSYGCWLLHQSRSSLMFTSGGSSQKGCHHGTPWDTEAEPRHRSTAAESATRPSTARPSGASEQLGGHSERKTVKCDLSGDPLLPIQFAWALEDLEAWWKLSTQHRSFSRTPGVSCWVELEISKPCQATALEIWQSHIKSSSIRSCYLSWGIPCRFYEDFGGIVGFTPNPGIWLRAGPSTRRRCWESFFEAPASLVTCVTCQDGQWWHLRIQRTAATGKSALLAVWWPWHPCYWYVLIRLPVVPHKAVAEVSKIGNL